MNRYMMLEFLAVMFTWTVYVLARMNESIMLTRIVVCFTVVMLLRAAHHYDRFRLEKDTEQMISMKSFYGFILFGFMPVIFSFIMAPL